MDAKAIATLIAYETKTIKHLAGLVPPGGHIWRPSEGQRSVLELMQYLTVAAETAVDYALTGSWDGYDAIADRAKTVTPETFAKAMDAQSRRIAARLKQAGRALAKPSKGVWGGPKGGTVGDAVVAMAVRFLAAYRMQLFLSLKGLGVANLSSGDCWEGKPRKAAAAT